MIKILDSKNISKDKIDKFLKDIRSNSINYLFYLPELKFGENIIIKESFVRFDSITSIPMKFFYDKYDKKNHNPDLHVPYFNELFSNFHGC